MSADAGKRAETVTALTCVPSSDSYRFGWEFCQTVEHWASGQPNKTAFVEPAGCVSYQELANRIKAMRRALFAAGVREGDCVAVILPSSSLFASLLFATMQLGANLVSLDVLYTSGEVRKRLSMVSPKLVFASGLDHVKSAQDLGIRVVDASGALQGFDPVRGFLALGEGAVEGEKPLSGGDIYAKLPALTIFTSGTTGNPKGVLLSAAALEHAVASINMAVAGSSEDVFLTSLPFSHIYGVNTGVLLPLAVGATSVLLPKFDSAASLDAIERYGVSVYNGVPSVYKRMMAVQAEHPRNLSSMRTGTIAGAQCTNLEDIQAVLHCAVRILYGSTESPILAMTRVGDPVDEKVTGVGRFNPTVESRIVDEQGTALASGKQGEVLCLSPGTMLGYLDNPQATAECLDEEGWIHTGDVGYVDEAGYLHIVGRKNDVINRGGYKVHPAEVEGVYKDSPAVFDCMAMGFPHEELGQQIVLFASLVDEASLTPVQLRCYAKDKLAKYKIPDQVILLERIPYLPTGKPDKQAMAAIYEAGVGAFASDEERQRAQAASPSL